MNAPTIWIPRDAAALAAGADDVADALATVAAEHGLPLNLVRNGSRGLLWLEPLLEVATPAGRVAFGPVQAADIAALSPVFTAGTSCLVAVLTAAISWST